MRISLNKVRQFEPGLSSTWSCSITGGTVDTSKMNLIDGKLPVSDVSYDKWSTKVDTVTIGPDIPVDFPVTVIARPTSISLTIFEDDKRVVESTLTSWVTEALKGNKAASKKDWAVLTIDTHNKQGKSIKTESYYVFPNMSLTWGGDQAYQASSYRITFSVKGVRSVK